MTDRGRSTNPVFARAWSGLFARGLARSGGDDLRRRLLADLAGTVVEVGAGDGANFAFYPDAVEHVVAVEPEPYLRERARARAAAAPVPVEVVDGTAAAIPVVDGHADAVVFCLVLCSVPDQRAALVEARRVLRAGGGLRFLEHVRAPGPGAMRRVQHALDLTVWPRLFGGCHLGRDTVAAVGEAGFAVTAVQRFWFPERPRLPMSAAVLGAARAP